MDLKNTEFQDYRIPGFIGLTKGQQMHLGPASGQLVEELFVQHLTWFLAPHAEQKEVL